MNKAELIDAVTARVGDKRTATAAVEAVLSTVQRVVTGGERVALSGFGVFEKVDRAARTARNPATGAAVQLAATSVPRFRPGQGFKDVVSGARDLPAEPDALAAPAPSRAPVVRRTAPAAVEVAAVAEAVVEAPVRAVVRAVRAVTSSAPAKAPAKAAAKAPAKKAPAAKAPAKAAPAAKAPARTTAAKAAPPVKAPAAKAPAKTAAVKAPAKKAPTAKVVDKAPAKKEPAGKAAKGKAKPEPKAAAKGKKGKKK